MGLRTCSFHTLPRWSLFCPGDVGVLFCAVPPKVWGPDLNLHCTWAWGHLLTAPPQRPADQWVLGETRHRAGRCATAISQSLRLSTWNAGRWGTRTAGVGQGPGWTPRDPFRSWLLCGPSGDLWAFPASCWPLPLKASLGAAGGQGSFRSSQLAWGPHTVRAGLPRGQLLEGSGSGEAFLGNALLTSAPVAPAVAKNQGPEETWPPSQAGPLSLSSVLRPFGGDASRQERRGQQGTLAGASGELG